MCTVSMIGDYYNDKWKPSEPWGPTTIPLTPGDFPPRPERKIVGDLFSGLPVSRKEFEQLKKQVEEMHELLKRAHEYDLRTNQHECHMDEKVELLKKIAKVFGIDLKDIFGEDAPAA